ncbi:unnamed protein product [Aureobasidium vineae]|uniref:Uncharacterized protein n=1 Tax=Aureobasidium vineae TaxID=2773715 RepID=A0A9N8JMK4_9PEZI|nr:unnamed protein product [Aureobasidium vineae]
MFKHRMLLNMMVCLPMDVATGLILYSEGLSSCAEEGTSLHREASKYTAKGTKEMLLPKKALLGREYQESSAYRRTVGLRTLLHQKAKTGRLEEAWSWKTHAPIVYPTRVDHHCTACDQDRYLKTWWSQKQDPTNSDESLYMCTRCFASDPDRIIPERHPPNLPSFFTDTVDKRDHP